jgi:hypothetical protein
MTPKESLDWLLPPRVQDVLRDAFDRLRPRVVRNDILRDRHAGARCFVLGNGPSLGGLDLRPLRDEVTIAANSFYKHPHSPEVDLKYLCIGDPDFMKDTPKALEWHRILDEHHPRATLFAHPDVLPLREKHGVHAAQDLFTFKLGRRAHRASELNLDLTRPLNVGQMTGSMLMIPLAIFLGARRIVLAGFDLNHHVDPSRSYHFYASHAQFPEFDSMAADRRYDYPRLLSAMQREFESHHLLAECARAMGVEIVNATRGGLLDAYPRVDFESELGRDGGD